ncbi:MAG: GDSL-type esterase/lipase family protein [Treponema sp.]|nr:GDSL-type esterase/lipase family protein [Treponema sp.]
MRKSFVLFALFALFATICFVGCASTQNTENTEVQGSKTDSVSTILETVDYIPNSDNVKFLGRAIFEKNALLLSYTNTGAAFNISANHLDVTLATDGSEARFAVFVNNERMLDTMVTSEKTFNVFDGTELIEGEVRIMKISESTSSAGCILKITTDKNATITPAPEKSLKLEFIGDSITCGYGVDDLVKENHFKVSTEDGTKSYAYKTAQNLNADFSMVSCSGWGVISGYSGDGTKQAWGVMSKVYGKFGARGNSIKGIVPSTKDWDFATYTPDVVVINLGTNDASYTKGNPKKITEFTEAYTKFIKDIREKNPDAYIFCALGIMGQDLYGAIEDAVSVYQEESGDEKVTALKFNQQSMADGIAADWHPSEKTHAKAAKLLTEKIKLILE